jgi:hypothetical protein
MARVFSDVSAARPLSVVQWAFLCLLQLLFECVCRPHLRGGFNARFRWEDSSFGTAAGDQIPAACNCHPIIISGGRKKSHAGGPRKTFLLLHPAMASRDCTMTVLNRLYDYMQLRSTRPDLCDPFCWREADNGIGKPTTPEGIIGASPAYAYVEERRRRRAAAIGRRKMSSHRPAAREVELCTSTCPGDRLPVQEHLSLISYLRHNFAHELELQRYFPQRISIDHGNLDDWSQRSWLLTIGDLESSEFSGQWCRQLWRNYSQQVGSSVQDGEYDSHDWREGSSVDSTGTDSELHDDSCNSVCSDADSQCSETLHGTVTTSTALVNFVLPRSTDNDTAASSSALLGGSSSNEASSSTTEQPGGTDDGGMDDDCDSSITTEELLVRQSDFDQETEVSMAQDQQASGNEGTSSSQSWLMAGFKFLPTDKDIVLYYLTRKVMNQRLPAHHSVKEGHNVYALDADEIKRKFRSNRSSAGTELYIFKIFKLDSFSLTVSNR